MPEMKFGKTGAQIASQEKSAGAARHSASETRVNAPVAAGNLLLTPEAVLGEFMKLAFANVHDYVDCKTGKVSLDLERLTRDHAAGIVELTVTTRQERPKEGNPPAEIVDVKFKLADKRQALLVLGRYVGLFDDQPEPPDTDESQPDFSDPKAQLELARTILFALDEAKEVARRAAEAKSP